MDHSPPNHASTKAFSRASEDDLLSIDLLQEVCGNEDLETVEEVEIIFNAIAEISNLDRCINLRSLSLIGVGLKRISNLACVGHCLERLSLSGNAITKIENLYFLFSFPLRAASILSRLHAHSESFVTDSSRHSLYDSMSCGIHSFSFDKHMQKGRTITDRKSTWT